jgi:uncharacterized protein DUF4112
LGRIEDDNAEELDGRVGNIRTLARVLDSAVRIPGTQIRVGADSIFGLVPVVGDIAGAALSGYIVLASARLGAPASTLARMVINIGIDTLVGSVPILGDMFDAGWRANMKNVDLLENHLGGSELARRANRWVVAAVVGGLVVLGVGAAFIGVEVIRLLARLATAAIH